MFQDTRPADLDASGGADRFASFRVAQQHERLRLLRDLRDGTTPVILNGPDGSAYTTALWAIDECQDRLSFNADAGAPALARLIEADEAVAVAYLESVKLQFDLQGLVLVRGAQASALQCSLPREIYRFQRRHAYRVRTSGQLEPARAPDGLISEPGARRSASEPVARLRHPHMPDLPLALRVLDLSIGGCALWLPFDVPPLLAGTLLPELQIELHANTRFTSAAILQHVGGPGDPTRPDRGHRLGCEWRAMSGSAERELQRWIDQAQKRRRLLSL